MCSFTSSGHTRDWQLVGVGGLERPREPQSSTEVKRGTQAILAVRMALLNGWCLMFLSGQGKAYSVGTGTEVRKQAVAKEPSSRKTRNS